MSTTIALIRAVLGPACSSDQEATGILQVATSQNIDLLEFLSHRFGIPQAIVYQRAAENCGLAFSAQVPRNVPAQIQIDKLDRLGATRSIRAILFDREVLFLTPGYRAMLTLGRQSHRQPDAYKNICIVPPRALTAALVARSGEILLNHSRHRLSQQWPFASAHLDLTMPIRLIFVFILTCLVGTAALAPFVLGSALFPLMVVLFLLPAWFRLSALLDEPATPSMSHWHLLKDQDLPVYSVLIPLRDEAQMVPQLAVAMQALDYPPEKLDIKFVVEETSPQTVQAVRLVLGDPRFELIVVPKSAPHTKPKATNYALPLVRGRYTVIYDAEDVPEPDQLRRAATRFAVDASVDCIQAELVIENADESWLTNLFAAEYSGLFGVMLPALARWGFPMPLGGTSNHFRTSSLREVGGWDAFNVTEDADLGVRLSRLRYGTGTLPSRTYEEAPVTLGPWMRQRTRWMKGWMQTFIVHNRYPLHFLKDAGWRNFIVFQIYVGSMIISAPLHVVFSIALIARLFVSGGFGSTSIDGWAIAHIFILVAGYIGAAGHSIAGAVRLRQRKLLRFQWLLPIYWSLSGIATIRAAYELLVRPYFWAKTGHGLTRRSRGDAKTNKRPKYLPDTILD